MRKLPLTLALAAALVALTGCARSKSGSEINSSLAAHKVQSAPRIAHLTRLGCVELRERLGLPALGFPSPAPPGMSAAQPGEAMTQTRRERYVRQYLAEHTNCIHQRERAHTVTRKQSVPIYVPPHLSSSSLPAAEFYPSSAQRLGEEGTAIVRVCIGPHGHVRSASIARSSGSATLDRAALRYARATSGRWVPAKRRGQPVSGCTTMSARFSMVGGL
jgi:TonB family protein